jgi:putative membrane protein (TIGR04086 family)
MFKRENMTAMGYGAITTITLLLVAGLFITLLLMFTSLTESSFSWFNYVMYFLALFVGGFVSGGKAKAKGWMIGAGTGLLFILFIFIFQYLGYQSSFSVGQYVHHGTGMIFSMFGGMLGVNLISK